MLQLIGIEKSFKIGPSRVDILKGVTLTVERADLMAIMGASGSGKSTLMNIIGMLDRPTRGAYRLDGTDLLAAPAVELARLRNRMIGFVFQSFHLLPQMTALQNICLPLRYRGGVPERQARAAGMALLERVGMADRAGFRPAELSGGQRQRVAIARALVGAPAVLLADEPTGALDTRTGQEIMDLFIEINETEAVTAVIITHDPAIARQCRRRVVMKDGVLADDAGDFERAGVERAGFERLGPDR